MFGLNNWNVKNIIQYLTKKQYFKNYIIVNIKKVKKIVISLKNLKREKERVLAVVK